MGFRDWQDICIFLSEGCVYLLFTHHFYLFDRPLLPLLFFVSFLLSLILDILLFKDISTPYLALRGIPYHTAHCLHAMQYSVSFSCELLVCEQKKLSIHLSLLPKMLCPLSLIVICGLA